MCNSVLIIGSGLGGLLTGFLLSKEGFAVTILEKHRKFGGCLQTFRRDHFTFDTGMHYFGSMAPGQVLHRYWKYFGLSDRLDLLQMDREGFDRISFTGEAGSGSEQGFPLAQGVVNFREQLLPFFPDTGGSLKTFTAMLDRITKAHPLYNLELPCKDYQDPYQSIPVAVFLAGMVGPVRNTKNARRRTKEMNVLSRVLCGNNFLYAGNPDTTSLSHFGLINHSFISSAWRLAGGSQQVADLLVEGIRAAGGKVVARKKVITIRKTGTTFQVTAKDGERFESELVISDIHPAPTINLCQGIPVPKAYHNRIGSLPNTASVFTLFLGLKPGSFPFLNYNLYGHTAKNIWAGLPSRGNEWPTSYLFMTPPVPNQGPYAATAMVMATMSFDEVRAWSETTAGNRGKEYFVFKTRKSKQLLELVYQKFPDLKDAIATIDISTPLTWRDYTGTPDGSMYGMVKDASNHLRTSISPKTKVPGLYFTGQNVNLHGALGVTIGAVMTCGEILGLPHVLEKIKREG